MNMSIFHVVLDIFPLHCDCKEKKEKENQKSQSASLKLVFVCPLTWSLPVCPLWHSNELLLQTPTMTLRIPQALQDSWHPAAQNLVFVSEPFLRVEPPCHAFLKTVLCHDCMWEAYQRLGQSVKWRFSEAQT